jgi:hypothetical protein
MRLVLAASLAELAQFQALGVLALVFFGDVVAVLADAARHGDDLSHFGSLFDDLGDDARTHCVAAFADGKP